MATAVLSPRAVGSRGPGSNKEWRDHDIREKSHPHSCQQCVKAKAVALRTENCWKLEVTPNLRLSFLVQIPTEVADDCGLLRAGTAAWNQTSAEN